MRTISIVFLMFSTFSSELCFSNFIEDTSLFSCIFSHPKFNLFCRCCEYFSAFFPFRNAHPSYFLSKNLVCSESSSKINALYFIPPMESVRDS